MDLTPTTPPKIGIFLLEISPSLAAQLSSLCDLLSTDEKEKVYRRKFESHRVEYAAAHALLRFSLSQWANVPAIEWRFERSNAGRPFVTNPGHEALKFSLSHTRGLVGCAIAMDCVLGFDLECLDRPPLDAGTIAAVLSLSERTALEGLDAQAAARRTLQLWTLKEAFFKGMGTGLKGDLRAASFEWAGGPQGTAQAAWASSAGLRFHALLPTLHHCGALCCSLDAPVETRFVSAAALVTGGR